MTAAQEKQLRILLATEYLPPYISGIANRCKNLVNGYRKQGHSVTVFSCVGTECDVVVPSLPNPFYRQQRTFVFPPLALIFDLLNPFKEIEYDICHVFAPLCLGFLPVLPLLWLRNVKLYVSYHVNLSSYRDYYFGDGTTLPSKIFHIISGILYPLLYFLPLTIFADCVGIPSKVADFYVFDFSKRVHVLKSGLDTEVFHPNAVERPLSVTSESGISLVLSNITGQENGFLEDIRSLCDSKAGPILLYCGRLALEKNTAFLIESLSNPLLNNACLVIVGDGPCRAELEQLAADVVGKELVWTGCGDRSTAYRVIFTGMILDENRVAKYYSQADIFVSASASETFGFTVAEAMACGTPAVVVKSGAFPSVYSQILDQMFEIDNKQQYAEICVRIFGKIKEHKSLARSYALNYGIETSVNDLIDVYRWILSGCPKKHD